MVSCDLLVLGLDLAALERSQPAQRQIEDRLRLQLREPELRHQTGARGLGILRRANQLDHRVEVPERDQQAFEDMQPRLGLAQLELRAPRQHAAADGAGTRAASRAGSTRAGGPHESTA